MPKQPSTPGRSVAFAAAALIVSLAAFGAAFYFYDGVSVLQRALSATTLASNEPDAASVGTSSTPPPKQEPTLTLPPGVDTSFALGMWRDQAGTQETIVDLIEGDIRSLRIVDVERRDDESVLTAVVTYADGISAPGLIVMRRLGAVWYVAFTEASLTDPGPIRPNDPLPSLSEIDIPLLNTMIAEQYKSRAVTEDYALGNVKTVNVVGITRGPDTATIQLEMIEKQGTALAQVVAIRSEVSGRPVWLLAKFTKTKDHD